MWWSHATASRAYDYLMQRRGNWQQRPQGNPAVVLLDLKLPKLDGIQVLRTIRSDPVLQPLPVVILTSSREEQDLVNSYKLGVNAYVVKPVGFPDFIEAIQSARHFLGRAQ